MARRQRAVLMVLALAIGMATYVVASIGGSAGAAARTTRTVTKVHGGYVTTIKYPNGDTLNVFGSAPAWVPTPSIRTAKVAGRTVHVESGTVAFNTGRVTQGRRTMTAVQELRAMGVSAGDAQAFSGLDAHGPHAVSKAGARTPSAYASTSSDYPIVGDLPMCMSKASDGGRIHVRGCDYEYRTGSARAGRIWYLENSFQAVGQIRDNGICRPCRDEFTGLKFGVQYPRGAAIAMVTPANRRDMGKCTDVKLGLDYKGVTAEASQTECPESFGLEDYSSRKFATKWDGRGSGPSNGVRNIEGLDGAYSTTSSSRQRTIYWTFWWE